MNIDIQKIVDTKIAELTASKQIETLIETGIESAIEHAINDSFSKYGSLSKQIEKGMKEGLQVNFKALNFDTYNAQMLSFITQKLGDFFSSEAVARFSDQIDNVIAPPPKEIEFTAFIKKIISFWQEDYGYGDPQTASVKVGGNVSFQSKTNPSVKIWKDSSETDGRADIELYINDETIRINHGQGYNPTAMSDAEAYIFSLYAAGTRLKNIHKFDEDECDLCIYYNAWD